MSAHRMSASQPQGLTRERTLTRLIERADRRLAMGRRFSHRLSQARLWWFLLSVAAAVVSFKLGWYVAGNSLAIGFVILLPMIAGYHNRLERRMHRWQVWQSLKRTHLARLRVDWTALPDRGLTPPPDHPYAVDLDVLGPNSLLRLLDTTLSTNGRARLSSWLLDQPDDRAQWEQRQGRIRELAALPLFRDRLTVEGQLAGEQEINGERLRTALLTPAGWPTLVPLLLAEAGLAFTTLVLLILRFLEWLPADYWMLSFGLYAFIFLFMDRSAQSFEHALSLQGELETFSTVLGYVERRAPRLPHQLRTLCHPLLQPGTTPSRSMKQAATIVSGLSVRANPIAHILANLLGPWDLYFTWRLQRLQSAIERHVPTWLDILAEVEAAGALGTFAWLHPDYAWPRVERPEAATEPAGSIVAERLGHPLIGADQRVTNDLTLEGQGRVLLVTGSNMSGKSTFLRTIGLNACLAQAGAPVCAAHFAFRWMRIRGCIRVVDSVEEGLSHFYAEVKRLKHLLLAAEQRDQPPVLFLIDEIFRGTNNRERLIGSRAFILALSASPAFGLVTTHDLELAELDSRVPRLANVHFQESVVQGRLNFDYRLRPGPCPTTNALRIMALEGLPTGEPPERAP